jgi:hypothetical protein
MSQYYSENWNETLSKTRINIPTPQSILRYSIPAWHSKDCDTHQVTYSYKSEVPRTQSCRGRFRVSETSKSVGIQTNETSSNMSRYKFQK